MEKHTFGTISEKKEKQEINKIKASKWQNESTTLQRDHRK